ncbi:uncharacterized protein V1518DRAFT_372475 [Limtongia smithiae]|uniref:uncharacterized protein n=1 Tax=Limtongia smithiae TaxID=1125753 RepID=UPI0034CF0F01
MTTEGTTTTEGATTTTVTTTTTTTTITIPVGTSSTTTTPSGTATPRPKTCAHTATDCLLTHSDRCCSCLDQRPLSDTARYDIYIDGRGTVNEGMRWAMYCRNCKGLLMSERQRVLPPPTMSPQQQQRQHIRQQRQRRIYAAFGTPQELSSDEYVSPLTSMFQRAQVWNRHNRPVQESQNLAVPAASNNDQQATMTEDEILHLDGQSPQQQQAPIVEEPKPRPNDMTAEELIVDIGCRVCFAQIANVVFLPCAHLAVCEYCADSIAPTPIRNRPLAHSSKLCPICRQLIKQKIKVWRV